MIVILVHGIFDKGSIFNSMKKELENAGHECYAPDLLPADARLGIADLAKKLAEFIEQKLGKEQPIAIVGFSMGCIVARYYLQELDGYKRTKAFYAISGPHHGTWTAFFYWGKGAFDLRPISDVLLKLALSEQCLLGIALFAYRTPYDLMILPSKSAEWKIAKNQQVQVLWHALMPRNKQICADILTTLHNLTRKMR